MTSSTDSPNARRRRSSLTLLGFFLVATLHLAVACRSVAVVPPVDVGTAATAAATEGETDADFLDRIVLALLDGEGLYTAAGGLKPVSSGYWTSRFEIAEPDLASIERARGLLDGLVGIDELDFGVQVFQEPHEGQRAAHAWVVHRTALRRVLADHAQCFAPLGLGPNAPADEVLAVVERQPRLLRYRCYGLLFGYPVAAVDFFVRAAAEEESGGGRVEREFAHVATFSADRHRFVWAVPAGESSSAEVRELQNEASTLLEQYRSLRERFIGPGKPGPVDLLRAVARLSPTRSDSRPAFLETVP